MRKFKILNLQRKENCHLSLHRQGFTLGELVIAMVVITLVVCVTLPITLSKMKKVDYTAYYMGYMAVKDMSVNILQTVLNTPLEEPAKQCLVQYADECINEPAFIPVPVSKSECEELAEIYDNIYGCYYEQDYYAGAVKACNGLLPRAGGAMKIFQLTDNGTDTETLEKLNLLNPIKFVALCMSGEGEYYDCPMDYTAFWYDLEYDTSGKRASVYTDATATGGESAVARNNATAYAVCLTPIEEVEPDESEEVLDSYNDVLCDKIKKDYNISASDCSVSPTSVQSKVTSKNFTGLTPNITMANGLKLYIGSDYEQISELSDAVDIDDRKGFKLYVDVNGDSGKNKLWEDVFPFYLLGSGKIVPAYNKDEPSGGNNRDHLSVNVIYDSYTGDTREIKLLMSDANFRSAACAVGYIKSSKYCDGKVQYDICKDVTHDCRMLIKEPVKVF